MMKINKDILIRNKWVEGNNLYVNGYGEYVSYDYSISNKFHLTITFGFTNSGRVAVLHIDNENFETIASADIDTVEQFNLMMKIIESEYELN